MINDEGFREIVEDIINNPDNYSKDEIHEAFMDMTERYLNEMITTMNLERTITEGFGKKRAEEILEEIATSNPSITDLDITNAHETDRTEVIRNLFDYTQFDLGIIDLGFGGDDDSPDEE